jgi:multidrug efflux pump subunit AcrA (membrane-fusion protein)
MDRSVTDLETAALEAQREADIQMGEKLAAQMTLKAVCDALDLPMVSLGNGWTEATPKILARIEAIVDEGERGFADRDRLQAKVSDLEDLWLDANKRAVAAEAEAQTLRDALEQIAQWDCLNPPDPNLCHDHPWLKRLVDDALANGDWWEQVEAARTRERRAATPDTPPDAPTEEGT